MRKDKALQIHSQRPHFFLRMKFTTEKYYKASSDLHGVNAKFVYDAWMNL